MRGPAHIAAAVLPLAVACAPLLKGDEHTLGELLHGASLTAGGLTFSNWQVDLLPLPIYGNNNQDIEKVTITANATGGPAVALQWDSASQLQIRGREEMDFTLRYTVTAQNGFVVLAKTELTSTNVVAAPFPGSAAALSVEQFLVVGGTVLRDAVVLDLTRNRPVDVRIVRPQQALDVATHIFLAGEQDDASNKLYDTVALLSMDQTFWRAARVLTVNSLDDKPDGNIGDGIADTGTSQAPTGVTTLRAALNEADGTPDLDFITFNIPGDSVPKLQPNSQLYGGLGALWPVIIDGTSQKAGWVELDGSNSRPPLQGLPTVGLEFVGQYGAVRGLVINRFDSHGIQIRQSGAPFKGNNLVVGNMIGTDVTGTQHLGNHGDGIRIVDQPDNLVGGAEPNLIVYNDGNGLTLTGSQSTANSVGENTIGGNLGAGILITDGAGANTSEVIPVPATFFSNTITANGGAGIRVESSSGDGNQLSFNSISANGGLGIDTAAGGPTFTGVPVLTSVISANGMTRIDGSLQGQPNRFYTIEFFVSSVGDPSSFGEGERPFAGSGLFTDQTGKDRRDDGINPGFPFVFSRQVPPGFVVTATVTVKAGSTSEFSQWRAAVSNEPPIADAGDPQTVNIATKVTLDGSASHDPDNSPGPLTFSWVQTAGPVIALNNPTTAKPDFTPVEAGVYTFTLTVNDGLNSSEDFVEITVNAPNSNLPPRASATAPATAVTGQTVALDGSGSSDPDNGPNPLTFAWSQLSGPTITLNGAGSAIANFIPTVAATYGFRLTVSDGSASDTADLTIVVSAGGQDTVDALFTSVQALALDDQSRNQLLGKLDSARNSLARGNVTAAQGQLGAFVNNVQALQNSRRLSATLALQLTNAANAIIASLDADPGKHGGKE